MIGLLLCCHLKMGQLLGSHAGSFILQLSRSSRSERNERITAEATDEGEVRTLYYSPKGFFSMAPTPKSVLIYSIWLVEFHAVGHGEVAEDNQ